MQAAADAVEASGTVILKPVDHYGVPQFFHFGDDLTGRGGVTVARDVIVCGEAMLPHSFTFPNGITPESGWLPDRTVIYGGLQAFYCPPTNPTATRLAVHGIYFANPELQAVGVKKSAGLEVSHCVIYDIQAGFAETLNTDVAVGIEATGLGAGATPELLGEFHVHHNVVKRREDLAYGLPDSGIVLQLAAMSAHVHDNTVTGLQFRRHWCGRRHR